MARAVEIDFDDGTLLLRGELPPAPGFSVRDLRFDDRVGAWRAPAYRYNAVIEGLIRADVAYQDRARAYEKLALKAVISKEPRPYQSEALAAWRAHKRRGVVVLPTGSGKSYIAVMALLDQPRSALVVAPTIDLMNQWHDLLTTYLGVEVGVVGGGSYDVRAITATTYDSAYLNLERLGDRFGLVVFDECHHLPGPSYALAARLAIAPFRLGLTATPERSDGREGLLEDLIGPTVYRRDITDMAGQYLADYDTETLYVDLDDEEAAAYALARKTYRDFLSKTGIYLGAADGWRRFLIETSRSDEGRAAFAAWREQRRISLATPRKLLVLRQILQDHPGDRVLVFTNDNATVYTISRDFLVPAITHQTKTRERHETLKRFNDGRYPILVTSKVLNEGVNIPEANIGVVLSGSATVREHVQRLGRLLRKVDDKRARLYEVVARGTAEESISDRRRQHDAYR